MRRLLAGLTAFAAACLVAGVSQIPQPIVVSSKSNPRPKTARIAITGDPQNYFTTQDAHNAIVFRRLIDLQIADIIAYRPDFVIIAGDLTDSTGGLDNQCGVWRISDDPNSAGLIEDSEWTNFRAYEYDLLLAAGIPVFLVIGNHDSCVDFQRHFSGAEWLSYTAYATEVDSRATGCGGGTFSSGPNCASPAYGASTNIVADTTHRKALYPTPIGTICVIGMPDGNGDLDLPWIRGLIGCGTGRPTLIVTHAGDQFDNVMLQNPNPTTTAQRNDVIAAIYGHFVCTGCALSEQIFHGSGTGLSHVLRVAVNTQEQRTGNPFDLDGTTHSGMSWWSSWEIDPVANTITLRAHNPYLGNISDAPPGSDFFMVNTSQPLPYSWCTEFGGPACP